MGGVPVLLMVAFLGITNACHPDDRFVAQETRLVQPDPSESGSLKLAVVQEPTDDLSPVEIPQMSCPAEPRLNPALNSRSVTVRKPQNPNPPSGFSFPSAPPSLAQSAPTLPQTVDRAGRTIDPAAAARGAVNGSTLPSTSASTAQPFNVPPFTNSGGTAGSVATGLSGPSTEPVTNRTTDWGQIPALGTTPAPTMGTATGQANPNLVTNRGSNGVGSPILATDTFGRVPGGLTTAPIGRSTQPNFGSTGQPVANSGTGFLPVPNTRLGEDHSNTNAPSTNGVSGSVAAAPTPVYGGPAPVVGVPGSAVTGSGVPGSQLSGVLPVGQPPISRFGANPSRSLTQPPDTGYPATDTFTTAQSGSRPDARLSSAQIAAGAWSVDAYGYPVDRAGQRMVSVASTAGNAVGNTGYQRNPWSPPSSTYPTANASLLNHDLSPQGGLPTLSGSDSLARHTGSNLASHTDKTHVRTAAISAPAANVANSGASLEKPTVIDPVIGSRPANASAASGQMTPGPVAAQPLFNGLLLISMVANIYLIFWLKNLRLQYHDMVAAKRMASSNPSSN